jgi:hypothetical protein
MALSTAVLIAGEREGEEDESEQNYKGRTEIK